MTHVALINKLPASTDAADKKIEWSKASFEKNDRMFGHVGFLSLYVITRVAKEAGGFEYHLVNWYLSENRLVMDNIAELKLVAEARLKVFMQLSGFSFGEPSSKSLQGASHA